MQLQKDLSLKRTGQLEFSAPVHKGEVKPLSKNRNPDNKKTFKKHIDLRAYGTEIKDTPGLDQFFNTE